MISVLVLQLFKFYPFVFVTGRNIRIEYANHKYVAPQQIFYLFPHFCDAGIAEKARLDNTAKSHYLLDVRKIVLLCNAFADNIYTGFRFPYFLFSSAHNA